jgi:hypothetical protein
MKRKTVILLTVAALHQGMPGQMPWQKTSALVAALPEIWGHQFFTVSKIKLVQIYY